MTTINSDTSLDLPFLDRQEELQNLTRFYERSHSRGAGFLILYGRKGVGKTRLLQQFLAQQAIADVFYWAAPPGDAAAQLQDFSQALARYTMGQADSPLPDFRFTRWEEALEAVAQIAEGSPTTRLFILEGFTDLCHNEMGVSSVFQHTWDGRLQDIGNLRLILSGTHISTMIREVFAYSAPLYFRANAALHLKRLPYTTLLDLFPDRTPLERLAIFTITGGTPAYLRYFIQEPDPLTALEMLYFAPESSFLADMAALFDERFEEPVLCRELLTAVAAGYGRPKSLSNQLGRPYEELQQHLVFLRLAKLIEEQPSVRHAIPNHRIRHELSDLSLYFYYRHVQPLLGQASQTDLSVLTYQSLSQGLGQFPFLTLCREWIWAAARTRSLEMMPERTGVYWEDAAGTTEYPIAIVDTRQKKLLVGEIFWESDQLTPDDLQRILRHGAQLSLGHQNGWTVTPIVFGRSAFTTETQQAATGVRLVNLAEIEALLLTARRQLQEERDNPSPLEIEF